MTDVPEPEETLWIADRATLRVFIQEHPGLPKEQVWEVVADRPQFDHQWLFEQAGQLPYATGEHTSSIRSLNVQRHDWGGDAASFEVVLLVGKWMVEQGAAAAFGYAFNEVVQAMRRRSRGRDERPLSKDEAVERAKWKVAVAYEVNPDLLTDRSVEETDDGSWTVELDAPDGTYTVALEVEDGCVVTTRMKVTRRDAGTQ